MVYSLVNYQETVMGPMIYMDCDFGILLIMSP